MTSINVRKIELAVREILKEILQEAHVPTKVGMPRPSFRPRAQTKVGMPAPQLPLKRPKTKTKIGMPAPQLPPEESPEEVPDSDEPKVRKRPLSRSDRTARDAAQAPEEELAGKEEEEEEGIPGYKKASGGKFFEGKSTNEK